jgi:hypothetical protein
MDQEATIAGNSVTARYAWMFDAAPLIQATPVPRTSFSARFASNAREGIGPST